MQLLMLGQRLESTIGTKLVNERSLLAQRTAKLEALSPLGILSRGYSVAAKDDGKVIVSVNDVSAGEHFTLRLSDGTVDASVN